MSSTKSKRPLPEPHTFSHIPSSSPKQQQQQQQQRGQKEKSPVKNSANIGNTDVRATTPSSNRRKDIKRREEEKEEIQVDYPSHDDNDDDTATEWIHNVELNCCESSPTLMELSVWDAELTRRRAEVSRDIECIYNFIHILRTHGREDIERHAESYTYADGNICKEEEKEKEEGNNDTVDVVNIPYAVKSPDTANHFNNNNNNNNNN
ncbi:uncharacterized protein TM35_000022530, partial [Trypanosoma theileri]